MRVDILTLFPGFFHSVFGESILKRAVSDGALTVRVHDLREYALDKHHLADDYRYGGGAGMLMKPEPFFEAMEALTRTAQARPVVVYPTPQGERFTQRVADGLAREEWLVFLCGHYKGIDHRVVERWVDCEYSLGDFVLTGGELAAAAMIDACVRMVPGVIGDKDSALTDSFRGGGLDGPHFTRPENYKGLSVPSVLCSGNHRNIERWRRLTADWLTKRRRPDLLSETE